MPKTIWEDLQMPTTATFDQLRARVVELSSDALMGVDEQHEFYDQIDEAELTAKLAPQKEFEGGFELSGTISITVNGRTFEVPIDGEEYFTVAVRRAVRNGRDPANAIIFLADEGAKNGERQSPTGWANSIGQ